MAVGSRSAHVTFESVTIAPIERSMPFVRTTNVSPAATRASGSAAFVIPRAWIAPKLPFFRR